MTDKKEADKKDWYLPEILQLVYHFAEKPAFAMLCVASKKLHDIGLAILYGSICFDDWHVPYPESLLGPWMHGNPQLERLKLLERTVSSSARCALSIRSLVLHLPEHCDHDVVAIQPFLSILDFCNNLETVQIPRLKLLPQFAGVTWDQHISQLQELQRLDIQPREASYSSHIPGQETWNISLLQQAINMPGLKHVTMPVQQQPSSLASWPVVDAYDNKIETLRLKQVFLKTTTLDHILRSCPYLDHLELGFVGLADSSAAIRVPLNWTELGQVLRDRACALESLNIKIDDCGGMLEVLDLNRRDGAQAWYGTGSLGSLQSLTRLETLQLAPKVLLGNFGPEAASLSDVLPTSLRHLHLVWFGQLSTPDSWADNDLVSHLVSYLNDVQPRMLKTLTLTYRGDTQLDSEQEEHLKTVCQRNGVQFRTDQV